MGSYLTKCITDNGAAVGPMNDVEKELAKAREEEKLNHKVSSFITLLIFKTYTLSLILWM